MANPYTRRGAKVKAAHRALKQALDFISTTDQDAAATIAGAILVGDLDRAATEANAWGERQKAKAATSP